MLGTVWDKKVDVGVLAGRDKVEKVWEDYVQGFDSTRGLFWNERAGQRNTRRNEQFRAGITGKKQELKRRKKEWERAVCDSQGRENEGVMEKYDIYIRVRDEVNKMRVKEWRRKRAQRQWILGMVGEWRAGFGSAGGPRERWWGPGQGAEKERGWGWEKLT